MTSLDYIMKRGENEGKRVGALMGENARFKNGHARVETRVLKTRSCRRMSDAYYSIGRQRAGVF